MYIDLVYSIGYDWWNEFLIDKTINGLWEAVQNSQTIAELLSNFDNTTKVSSKRTVVTKKVGLSNQRIIIYILPRGSNAIAWLATLEYDKQMEDVLDSDIVGVFWRESSYLRSSSLEMFEIMAELGLLPRCLAFRGITDKKHMPTKVVVKSYPLKSENRKDKVIIDKSIEFPSEYYSAGLGILNFFGTYLREQYPEENAKVKIEQDGLIVRLVVSTIDGKSEVIEKALQEYELIITGNEVPESIVNNHSLVLELKNELRMAAVRVEMQKDIMSYQQADIKELREILKTSLSQNHTIVINANPTATATAKNDVNITINISQVLKGIADLKSELASGTQAHKELQEVEKAVDAIKNETDPNVVKHSSAMNKLGGFIKKFGEDTDKVNKAISTGKKAWETFKELAGAYNSIAQWCGLPQVPTIFTK